MTRIHPRDWSVKLADSMKASRDVLRLRVGTCEVEVTRDDAIDIGRALLSVAAATEEELRP